MKSPNAQEIGQVSREVLARPEFQDTTPDKPFWLEWFYDFIDFLTDLQTSLDASPALKWLIVGILSVLLVVLIGHIIYTILSEVRLMRSGGGAPTLQKARIDLADGRQLTWQQAARLANDAFANKNYHEAISIAHRLVLHWFDHQNVIQFLKWKTNQHYLAECPVDHPKRPLIERSTQLYDNIIYAHQAADSGALAEVLGDLKQLGSE